jgi:hypothetical protein
VQKLKGLRWSDLSTAQKIVVEAIIPAPVELVWERTQDPEQHVIWDIRFDAIRYLEKTDDRGFQLMDYRTRIGFGMTVHGIGRYLQNSPPRHSTFEFESDDWKSIITLGRGIWQYDPCPEGTYFKTVYDYDIRYGPVGRLIDRLFFRRLMQLATEWGFESLRRWCGGENKAILRRNHRWEFIRFFIRRLMGNPAVPGAAQSWLGTGKESNIKDPPSGAGGDSAGISRPS